MELRRVAWRRSKYSRSFCVQRRHDNHSPWFLYMDSGVTITKGIIQGSGSGRVIGRSTSSVAIGTGSKTFATQSGLSISNGQTLTIERTGTPHTGGNPTGVRTWMTGTVTSYSGTTLVMDITSTAGSGTETLWIISTQAILFLPGKWWIPICSPLQKIPPTVLIFLESNFYGEQEMADRIFR